jgi:ribulose 1,5-bisphosphate carboxylase large subunit-like protein
MTEEEYKQFYDDFDPYKIHGVRVAYMMHRAIHMALEKVDLKDGVEFEVLRLLRSWGVEVLELPFIPGSSEPQRNPVPDLDEDAVYTKEGEQ